MPQIEWSVASGTGLDIVHSTIQQMVVKKKPPVSLPRLQHNTNIDTIVLVVRCALSVWLCYTVHGMYQGPTDIKS